MDLLRGRIIIFIVYLVIIKYKNIIYRYDPYADEWHLCGDMPEPRFSMGVVTFEGLIYIVGGSTNSRRHLPDLIRYFLQWNKKYHCQIIC